MNLDEKKELEALALAYDTELKCTCGEQKHCNTPYTCRAKESK